MFFYFFFHQHVFTIPTPNIHFFPLIFKPTIMTPSYLSFPDLLFLFFPFTSHIVLLDCPRTAIIQKHVSLDMPVLAALNQLWGDWSLCFNLWSEFFRISKLTKQHIQVLSCNLVLWLKETGTKVGSKAKVVWNPCRTDWWNFWGEIKLAVV